jgi:hypothetical protein
VTAGTPTVPAEPRSTISTSVYREALDATLAVLERRARNLRNLVVLVSVIGVASFVGALVTRPAAGLAGLLVLVPACGFFFFADATLLSGWRSALIASWVKREVDFAAFRDALRATPSLPTETSESMLATLPSAGDLVAEQRLSAPTRQGVAAASRMVHATRTDALLLNVAAAALGTTAVVAAIWTGTWKPLAGLMTLLLCPLVAAVWRRQRLAAREAEVAACRAQSDFQEPEYARIVAALR